MPISFFKKLRRTFSFKSQFQKYLAYAIGEIILVVVGILIAIQINNYRNSQNRKQVEKELLLELSENLKINKEQLKKQIRWDSLAISSGKLILKVLDSEDALSDSLRKHFHYSRRVPNSHLTTTAYKAIENKGFDIISSKELRNQIIDLFDNTYQSMILEINNIDQNILKPKMQNYMIDHFMSDGYPTPNNFQSLKKDQQYKNILSFNIFIQEYFLTLRKHCLEQIDVTLLAVIRQIKKDTHILIK